MMRSIPALLLALLISALPPAAFSQTAATVIIPAGDTIALVNTREVWMKTVQPGNPLYLQVVSSLTVSGAVVIPSGTYAQATIAAFTLPKQGANQGTMHLRLDKLIYPSGYTVTLSPAPVALITIDVAYNYDLLLDNGTALSVTLTAPLTLDAQEVAQAAPMATDPGPFKPGTLCRDTPEIPATDPTDPTPDTVIPGSPGTPDTIIPGVDGAPDITIPGSPATPDITIPGSPGSPGTPEIPAYFCPPPPIVPTSTPE